MKYFTKEVKIGLTGAVAIAALFIGLNFLKGMNLFKASNAYYIEFSDIKGSVSYTHLDVYKRQPIGFHWTTRKVKRCKLFTLTHYKTRSMRS